MKIFDLLYSGILLVGIAACQNEEQANTPASTIEEVSDAYHMYLQSAANGHSYAEALSFHSEKRQSEMISWIEEKSKTSNKTIDQYEEFFLSLTMQEAKCLSTDKPSGKIDGKNAVLNYKGIDICSENNTAHIQVIVKMVFENGWKIHSENVNISMKSN